MPDLELPPRYEPLTRLGKGGGGEVWAVRDRHSGQSFALKVLSDGASEREMAALVREAVALSGLEGLGVPRVVRFGRLPGTQRPFLVRELVDGRSLEELISQGGEISRTLEALARAADQLTVLHRAGLLHGDVKPANIIVQPSGAATLVDLGLAAPWREGGAPAEGLTPRYAAPELFEGKPLTVRAEVYALGIALAEAVAAVRGRLGRAVQKELEAVAARATGERGDDRFPSADEFASSLRRAAALPAAEESSHEIAALWPVVGIDGTSASVLELIAGLGRGGVLRIVGPPASGRSALLRRVAWSLGVQGLPLAWIDETQSEAPGLVEAELGVHASLLGVTVLVDDADALEIGSVERLRQAREAGARLVLVGGARFAEGAKSFELPPLDERAAMDLVRRAIPSLTDGLLRRVVEASGARPGELRRLVRLIASQAVAGAGDIERLIGAASGEVSIVLPDRPLERAVYFLDRGRFNEARAALESLGEIAAGDELAVAIAGARLDLGMGDAARALERLESKKQLAAGAAPTGAKAWALYLCRSHIGVGNYAAALEIAAPNLAEPDALGAETLAYQGLALSYLGRHDEARASLDQAVERARSAGSARVEAVALASRGVALQRSDRVDEARDSYQRAIAAAEQASDAGLLATAQLNLASLLKVRGDIAGAIEHFEAAVDMGRRSGRRSAARHALLNLANTDLYLGRLARARVSIEALDKQRLGLSPAGRSQLLGLQAELAGRSGQTEHAVRQYEACAAAWEALGHGLDAAEARLEGALVAARSPRPDLSELKRQVGRAKDALGDAVVHQPLLLLAEARIAHLAGDESQARALLEQALSAARDAGQREWTWRALEARAEVEEGGGQPLLARRDREEALAVLENIGARLPRDLREVYWNDPRRRALRAGVQVTLGSAATEYLPIWGASGGSGSSVDPLALASSASAVSSITQTPLEQKLAKILEINSELVGVLDLDWMTARITDHAVDLLRAERGFVVLRQDDGSLSVHTSRSRSGDEPHAEFSRSIAESVVKDGEAVVSLSARDDVRLRSFASVHQMMLQSVACVPILAPSGKAIGALYVETRARPGDHFERELPTLRAFADQVAIAIETARLINENKHRADELFESNQQLEEAQQHLRELLGERTEKLKRARQKLRDARDTLYGHFGYQGLVGTSASMRRVYALVERVKDTDVPVLVTGESGTGKEMVARAIHVASPRGKSKFLGVNCGAIPEHLLESELFGHVRGAFTGADRDRKGLFREAEGGTILLDEIGEMPQKMQSGLLRVLQERTVRPVGGTAEEPVDVRVIFATNRDLEALVREGRFREDLYYRIHVVELRLPALRERTEDIPQLVDHFLGIFAARYKRERNTVSREAMRRLMAFDWPGNVRQLEHVLLNAWVLTENSELEAEDFDLPDDYSGLEPEEIDLGQSAHVAPSRSGTEQERSAVSSARRPRKSTLSQHRRDERERILKALQACNWNRVKAAQLSGIPRRTFYRRLREYGIQ